MGKLLYIRNATRNENQMDTTIMKYGNKKRTNYYWKLATWNVRGFSRKSEEVIQELEKCQIYLAVISEKKKGKPLWN
jgi:hypothetical protein